MTNHRVSQITLPALSFKNRNTAYVEFLSLMVKNEDSDKDKPGRRPATVAKVLNLQDGATYLLLCPSLLITALNSASEDYVGKCYEIHVSTAKVEGKEYKAVNCWRIEPDADYSKMDIVDKPDDNSGKKA